ncbi:MAG: FtsQ-type POTRA domain-containing protein [Clostridia bacterium]|nr:FtsQ-type POTRA domain-containing protein [Clostridia bacterium]
MDDKNKRTDRTASVGHDTGQRGSTPQVLKRDAGVRKKKKQKEFVRQYVMTESNRSKWSQEYMGLDDVTLDTVNVTSAEKPKNQARRRPADESTERRQKAKIMLVVFGVLLAVLLIYPIAQFCRSKLIINDVWVEGESPYTAEEMMSAAGLKLGDLLYSQNKSKAAELMLQNLPYLDTCKVIRKLPDKLVIKVTSSQALMYAKIAGEYYALSSELRVLERSESAADFIAEGLIYTDLPKTSRAVVGSRLILADDADAEYIKDFIKIIVSSNLEEKVTRLFFDEKFDIVATVSGKYRIRFGSPGDATLKVMTAARIIESEDFGSQNYAVIDVSIPTLASARYEMYLDPDSRD